MSNKQVGFTLVELMVALALGLVISAAATMLFLTASRSQTLQQGQASLQDDANFGLNAITQDIRLGNLNSLISNINDSITYGGVIFRSRANPLTVNGTDTANLPMTLEGSSVAVNLLSRSHSHSAGATPQWSGISNANTYSSDQLSIQYLPQYILDDKRTPSTVDDVWYGGFDCEGNELEFTLDEGRHVIVQRYFLRVDDNKNSNEPNQALALACDAGHYPLDGDPTTIKNFGDAGQIILKRADHFRVLYGIQNGPNHRYIDAKTYLDLPAPRPRILLVQLGILGRSNQSVGHGGSFEDGQVFQVLDQAVSIKTPAAGSPKYARQVVTQSVALRNTFGERGQ